MDLSLSAEFIWVRFHHHGTPFQEDWSCYIPIADLVSAYRIINLAVHNLRGGRSSQTRIWIIWDNFQIHGDELISDWNTQGWISDHQVHARFQRMIDRHWDFLVVAYR